MILANEESFEREIKSKNGLLLAMFYAKWCPFCQKLKPIFESYENKTSISLAEVDISDEGNLWDLYSINYVPTLIAFKDGKVVARRDSKAGIGLKEEDIKSILEELSKIS
ncbi:MAG: thioredoxin family protein [Nitrososphaerales archaeon]